MSLPRYDKYKDSDVKWLGTVPSHWQTCAAKRWISSKAGGTLIKGECPSEPTEGLFPAFSASGQDVWISEPTYSTPGIVLSAVGARCGKTFKADGKWGVVANTHCLFPLNRADRDFLWYLTNQEDWWERGGTAQPFIKVSETLARTWMFPPPDEQAAIAAFLDRETAKIDALIAEQERLIALLAEKRQATISHAVTKGLNPNAPMKDSGVAWLGEVPSHWLVRRLKQVVRPGVSISYGIVQPGEPQDEGVPFVQTSNMSDASFSLEQLQRTTFDIAAAYPRSCLSGGEVILGIRASIGAAHVVPQHLAGANLSRGIARIECGNDITPAFLVQILRGSATLNYWGLSKQGSTFNEVSIETVRELVVAVPPLGEQKEINEFLDEEIAKVGELLSHSQTAVALLNERRSALIAAAVTGQIDVRNVALR
jgi:type I restriction enzyme S subunit